MFMLLLGSFCLYIIGNFWTTSTIQKHLYRFNTVEQEKSLIYNSSRESDKIWEAISFENYCNRAEEMQIAVIHAESSNIYDWSVSKIQRTRHIFILTIIKGRKGIRREEGNVKRRGRDLKGDLKGSGRALMLSPPLPQRSDLPTSSMVLGKKKILNSSWSAPAECCYFPLWHKYWLPSTQTRNFCRNICTSTEYNM